ncbi:LysR family transcriptional regulator [Pseudomonas aeruginosa]|nr:LysR family transcriptional regulator [Pseudomonas aeruginosa]EIU3354731.1 LysR family transcriptional regulator [Pseudomonas aeruginosa]EIU3383089.1 LysR family transcriptional regulator [Pseudomonas aeruginosa]EIU3515628.1 LysR family transcriptional regulator [Pseudomonas aeruginosa]EIU3534327.1 LysR family transcriptional regulator [Pseudomonas aeruginosa]
MDRLGAMHIFVRAVELGSMSAAAVELDLSSQLAGRQVRVLEGALGIKLLNRTTRRQSLTDGGRLFYERAKNILAEMEAAQAQIDESRALPRGRLRISAPITFGSKALAPQLAGFMNQFPDVSVELCLTNRTVDLVDEGFDVVFRTGDLPDSGLMARRLAPHRLILCASTSYLKTRGHPRTPEDLRKHECLVFTHTSLRTQWSFEGPNGSVKVPIKGRFSTDSGEALRAAALAGVGIILQPAELLADDIQAGLLTRVLKRYEPTPRALHVLYAPDRRMTPKLRAFLDFASYAFAHKDGA